MEKEEEKCCGNCCWFCFEQTDGDGQCMTVGYIGLPYGALTYCDTPSCKHFVSRQEMRHYMAVLLQANRYRRDQNVPPIYRMPNPTELGKAIDFAVKYMKVFSKL